ncbi:hypothetical protein [Serratia ficaria]|uniref:hypothetical protein n=1 Tax=Serratia ficaria TaxID=61651 RepID=UPI0021B84492|nr:hypothetical protein [Serratia ficaria]
MRNLKSAMMATAILLSVSTHANANDTKTLQTQLKPWQPLEITTKENSLTVVLPGKEVTSEAYSHLIISGVCTPLWTHDAPALYLKKLRKSALLTSTKRPDLHLKNHYRHVMKLHL